MARARNIKPSFFKNEELAELSFEARLLFIGTWTLSDREGRLEDRPKRIKMEIFPADSIDVDRLLTKLHEAEFIHRYEINGERYIQVLAFLKHQNPHHREPASVIPPCPSLRQNADGTWSRPRADDLFEAAGASGSPGASRADSLIPDSPSRIPDSPSRIPLPGEKHSAASRRAAAGVHPTVETWNAYANAYQQRWGIAPIRNAKVNGMLARFVERVPAAEAPDIAAFYVGNNKGLYVSAKHCVDLLLRDAEGLRTEWATGRVVTETEARQADRSATTGAQVQRLLAEHKDAA